MGRSYSQKIYIIRRYDNKEISEYRSRVDDPVLEEDQEEFH